MQDLKELLIMNYELRIKILLCISIIFVGAGAFAKTKIALIGDSEKANQIADIVMAKMSEKFSFLERSEINKILKERKLSLSGMTGGEVFKIGRIIHADILFVITSQKKAAKIKNYSVIAFNAKNGIRLAHFLLPAETETAADKIIESFAKTTQTLKNIDTAKFVSFAAVRDSGVPFKYWQAKNFLIADLKRRLENSSNLILLERDHLEALNKERKVSEKTFKLAAAASILHFEFSPGKSADIVNLTLRIRSSSGKLQFRDDIGNCFNNPQKAVSNLLNGIVKNLKISLAENIPSAKEEARHYYNQSTRAKRYRKYALAKRKLSAAIALDPQNLNYIKAMIYLLSRRIFYSFNDPKIIRPIVERLEECMYWCDKYYSTKGIGNSGSSRELIYYHVGKMLNNMKYRFRNADPKLRKRMVKIAAELKPKRLKEIYRPDKVDSINDLRTVLSYKLSYLSSYIYYEDKTKYFTDVSKAQLSGLKLIESFFNKYPEKRSKQINSQYPMLRVDCLPYPYLWKNACADYFLKSEKLIKAYKLSSVPVLKLHGYKLELCRKLLLCSFSRKDSTQYVIDYCRNIEQFKALGFSIHIFPIPDEDYFPKKYEREHVLIKNKIWKLVNSNKKIKSKFIPLKSSLLFRFSDEQLKETCEKDVRKIKTAVLHNNKIYLVYQRDGYRKTSKKPAGKRRPERIINIAEYDIKNAKAKDLKELYCHLPPTYGKPPPVAVEDGYMVIGIGYRIFYFNLYNNSPVKIINKLPLTDVLGVSVLNGRIYAFLGRKGYNSMRDTMLFSCLPDGSKRKIHISTSRIDKQHPFDKHRPFNVLGMFADKINNRLIFSSGSSEKGGLWAFYPKSGKCEQLIKAVSKNPLFRIKNMVYYLSACSGRFFTYNLKRDRKKIIFDSGKKLDMNLIAGHQWGSYFLNRKYFWTCLGGGLFSWGKDNFKQVASIALRGQGNQTWIFPHTDGRSAIAIKGCSIYKIMPPKKK
jgi:hypothetical protein